MNRTVGYVFAVIALLIWSAWFAVTRMSVTHALRAPDIAMLRLAGGAIVLLPFYLRHARQMPQRAWRQAIFLSICWGAPFVLLVALGIQLTSAAHAAALTPSTMAVFAGLLGWALSGVRPSPRQGLGYAVILGGVIALTLGTHVAGATSEGETWGDIALLVAALMWAAYTVRLRRTGLNPVQAAFLVCLYSAVGFLPVYVIGGYVRLGDASWGELALQAFYQGVLVGGLSVVAYNEAIARLGMNAAAVIVSLVPVLATLLAIPILGDIPTWAESVAITVIAIGVFLAVAASGATRRISVPSSAAGASR